MRILLFILAVSAMTFGTAKAQIVDDVSLDTVKVDYILVMGYAPFGALSKVRIYVDYGQPQMEDSRIKDNTGKVQKFNSVMAAFNFFARNGWDFVNAYAITIPTIGGSQNVYHYLFKRKPKD